LTRRQSALRVSACALAWAAAAAPVAAEVAVQWSGGELSVRAKGQALSAVLQDISRQTGLQVRGGVQQQDVVRADIGPETLADALRLLLADKNYLFVDGQGARPARLIILGSGGPGTVAISPVAPQPVPSNDAVSQHARALAGRDVRGLVRVAALALVLQASASHAAVTLWDNGGPAAVNQGGSNMAGFIQAANFNTSFATNLTGVSFWNLEAPGAYAGSIFYRIVGNSAGSPDDSNVLTSGTVSPTRTAAGTALGLNVFQNDFNIAVAGLAAGSYWLELHNGALSSFDDTVDFYWSFADSNLTNGGANDDQEFALPAPSSFTGNFAEHAFRVFGDRVVVPPPPPPGVPEPATLLLAALGMGVAALTPRRRRSV
jgi:hypothetical protein